MMKAVMEGIFNWAEGKKSKFLRKHDKPCVCGGTKRCVYFSFGAGDWKCDSCGRESTTNYSGLSF